MIKCEGFARKRHDAEAQWMLQYVDDSHTYKLCTKCRNMWLSNTLLFGSPTSVKAIVVPEWDDVARIKFVKGWIENEYEEYMPHDDLVFGLKYLVDVAFKRGQAEGQ